MQLAYSFCQPVAQDRVCFYLFEMSILKTTLHLKYIVELRQLYELVRNKKHTIQTVDIAVDDAVIIKTP